MTIIKERIDKNSCIKWRKINYLSIHKYILSARLYLYCIRKAKKYLDGGFSKNSHIYIHNSMHMGEIHKLYPTTQDSLNRDIFLKFEKYYKEHTKDILQTLIKNGQTTIVTDTGKEIVCILQEFHGKDFITNPYGREYHILLDSDDQRFGCHIEHRLRPVTGELWAQWVYPSSWMITNRKTWRSSAALYPNQEDSNESEQDISVWKLSLA